MHTVLRKHIITMIILGILLVGALGGLFVLFRFIQKKTATIIDTREQIATYQVNKTSLSKEVEELRLLEEKVTTLSEYVVTVEGIPNLLSDIEKKAMAQGVAFEITDVATPTKDGTQKLFIDFTLSGSYQEVRTFLALLEAQSYATTFTELDIIKEVVQQSSPTARTTRRTPREVYRAFGVLQVLSF